MSNDTSSNQRPKRQRKDIDEGTKETYTNSLSSPPLMKNQQAMNLGENNNMKNGSLLNRETEERSRERNRIHARKSRQRRKVFVEHLKTDLENCVYEANNLQTLYCQAFGSPYVSPNSSSSSSSNQPNHINDDTTTNDDDDDDEDDTGSDDDSQMMNAQDNNPSSTDPNNPSSPLTKIDREARCRERNRIHAKKSRQRKKLLVEQLKQRLTEKSNDIKAMRTALAKYYGSPHHPDLLKIPTAMMMMTTGSNGGGSSSTSHAYSSNDNGTYFGNDGTHTTESFLSSPNNIAANENGNDHHHHSTNNDDDDDYDEQNNNIRKSLSGRILRNRPAPLSPSIPQPVKGRGRGRPPKSLTVTEYNEENNISHYNNTPLSSANDNNIMNHYSQIHSNDNGQLSNDNSMNLHTDTLNYSNMYYNPIGNGHPTNSSTGETSTIVSPYSTIHSYNTNNMNSTYDPYYNSSSSSTLPSSDAVSFNHRKRSYPDHNNGPESGSHGTGTNSTISNNNSNNNNNNNNSHHHHPSQDYYPRDHSYYSHNASSSNHHGSSFSVASSSNPSSSNQYRNTNGGGYGGTTMMNSQHTSSHPNDYTNHSKVDYDTAERAHELQGYRTINDNGNHGSSDENNTNHHPDAHGNNSNNSNNHHYPPSSSLSSSNHSHPSSGSSSGFDQYNSNKQHTNPPRIKSNVIEPDYNDPYLIIPALLPPNPLEFILPDDVHIGAAYSKFLHSYENYYDRELAPKLRYKYGSDSRNIPSCYKPDYYSVIEALILARAGMLPLYNHAQMLNQDDQHHTLPPLPQWKAHPLELLVRREYARQLSVRPDEGHSVTPTSDSGGASSDARRQGETEQMSMEQKSNSTEDTHRSDRSNDDADSSNPESSMVSPADGDNGGSSNNSMVVGRKYTSSGKKKHSKSSSKTNTGLTSSSNSSPTVDPRNASMQDQQVAADLVLCMRNTNTSLKPGSGTMLSSSGNKGSTMTPSGQSQTNDSRLTVSSDSSSGQRGDDDDTPSSSSSLNNNTTDSSRTSSSKITNPNFHRYTPAALITNSTTTGTSEPGHPDSSSDSTRTKKNSSTTNLSEGHHSGTTSALTNNSHHSTDKTNHPNNANSNGNKVIPQDYHLTTIENEDNNQLSNEDTYPNPDSMVLLTFRHA